MAKTTTCDLCGEPAVDEIEVKSKLTTPIKIDVCESHLAEYKKTMREFTGQDLVAAVDFGFPDSPPVITKKDAQPE